MNGSLNVSPNSFLKQPVNTKLTECTQKSYEWRNRVATEVLSRCKPMADLHNDLAEMRKKRGNRHRAIPEQYWERALQLCDQFPVHVVAAVAPITYATLKDRYQQVLLKRAGLKGGKITIRKHSIDGNSTSKVTKKTGIQPDRRWTLESFIKNNPRVEEVLPGFAIQSVPPSPPPLVKGTLNLSAKTLPKPIPTDLKPMNPTKAEKVLADAIEIIMDTPVDIPARDEGKEEAMKEASSVPPPIPQKGDSRPLAAIRYAGIALDIFNKEHLKSIITDFFDVVTAPKV